MSAAERNDTSATGAGQRRLAVAAAALAILAAAAFGFLASRRPGQEVLWGDEGTYVAMTASLARDLDLRFEQADREWALERVPGRGVAVILQRTAAGITYSKPLLYPLLSAPAYWLFGEPGMLLVNGLALFAGLLSAWIFLRRLGPPGHAWLTIVTFAVTGTLIPYLAWRMSESLQVGLALAGTVLVCGALRYSPGSGDRWQAYLEHRRAPLVGGFLLGLLVSMRFSNALLVGGVLLAVALKRRWPRLRYASIGAATAILLLLALSHLALGTASPYTAERSSFNARIGYPVGSDLEEQRAMDSDGDEVEGFAGRPATHQVDLTFTSATLFSALYFAIGRHTGLIAYFPMVLILAATVVRGRDRIGLAITAGALALAVFYLLYTPHNYFGGSTFLGNRYFLIAYPALLVGLWRLPSVKSLLIVIVVGLAFGGSAMLSVHRTQGLTTTSQSHTAAGLFRWLPYESTAIDIQGHAKRFWSLDYVRFADPWADVKRNHFVLHADRPSAEMLIASRRPRQTMHFLARTHDGSDSLIWADWRADGSVSLTAQPGRSPVRLSIEPSNPWRRHRFWFRNEETYDVRMLRFAQSGPNASTTEIYYLGGGEQLESGLARQLLDAELPERATGGEGATARLRVKNTSLAAWQRRNVLPVSIGYRIEAEDGLVAQERRLLPADVAPGEEIDLAVDIQWPDKPGDYTITLDLWLHPLYWFEEKLGEPLVKQTVRIE